MGPGEDRLPAGWDSLQPGESWSDPGDHCVTHECEKHWDGLEVVTTKKACPLLNCPAVSPGSTPARPSWGAHSGRGGSVPVQEWVATISRWAGTDAPSWYPLPANGTVVHTGQGSAQRGRLLPLLPPTLREP